MHKKFFNAIYALNIFFQGFFSLLTPIALALLLAWLCTSKLSAPTWVYAPFAIVGVAIGFLSMIRFIIAAGNALERLEQEQSENDKKKRNDSGNNK